MKKKYKVYRKQLFETDERAKFLQYCEEQSIIDKEKGRIKWQVRWMLVHLAMHTGLRSSEIAKLTIQNVHIIAKPPYLFVHQGKRGKDRDVSIDRELTKHLQEFIRLKKSYKQSIEPTAPLLTGQKGKPYTTTALHISFREALKQSGVARDGLSLHSARHSYASLLYHKTKDLRAVQDQLGHADLNMTSLYANIFPEERSRIANSILDDEKLKFKRTKPARPFGRFTGNKPTVDIYKLQWVARELNEVIEPDPLINVDSTMDELIDQLHEASQFIVWEDDSDMNVARDDITDETRKVLKEIGAI